MKLGIMQPYFFPYIGYFQLINSVDKFIIYDDVNFIKNGWINRNNYLEKDKAKLFTLPIESGSSFKKINETYIKDNDSLKMRMKIVKTLKTNYSKAPYYDVVIKLCEEILSYPENNVAKYNENLIRKVCEFLNIETEILLSSNIQKNESLKGEEKLIHICKTMGTKTYINSIGGRELYNQKNFEESGLELRFIKPDNIRYNQFDNEFIPNLSIIDVLMFNGVDGTRDLLDQYVLED